MTTSTISSREAAAFIEKADPRPFFLYLNYTVPHAELREPEEALAPMRGKFPETPFVNAAADATLTGPAGGASLGYRSQPTPKAAFAAMITRMDRDIGRLADLVRSRTSTPAPSSCSSATTDPIKRAVAIRCSSRARADCAASNGICTRAVSACR